MKLTYAQRTEMVEKGYVIIPGVVPKVMVREAVKAINHSIGQGSVTPDHRGANYCKELSNSPVITNLLNKTPAWELAESVIGAGMIHPVSGGVQIALRFPSMEDHPVNFAPHLDGVLKVKEGIVQNFTALVGIVLNDLPDPYMGNFTVYPGTHQKYEHYFREHGPEVMLTEEAIATKHHSANVPLPEPVQITCQAGDMIFAHYQLIHAAGPNLSDQIRYACFFRLDHFDRSKDWKAPLTDLWLHWPGIREILSEAKQNF